MGLLEFDNLFLVCTEIFYQCENLFFGQITDLVRSNTQGFKIGEQRITEDFSHSIIIISVCVVI